MNTPEKCPKCNATYFRYERDGIGFHRFTCETTVYQTGVVRLEGLICVLRQRDQLAERVRQLELSMRECSEKMKRFRSRWLAAHQELRRTEDMVERAEERVKRLEEAGDSCCIYGPESVLEQWRKAKETIP
jgi:predicted DNA-binding protein YlxM (UPF0122 family)